MSEYGIENLKQNLLRVVDTAKAVASAFDDGKITLFEGIALAPKAVKIWEIVKDYPDIKAEYLDLDEAEQAALIEWFAEEFDIENDAAEHAIEAAFSAVVELSDLVVTFSKKE